VSRDPSATRGATFRTARKAEHQHASRCRPTVRHDGPLDASGAAVNFGTARRGQGRRQALVRRSNRKHSSAFARIFALPVVEPLGGSAGSYVTTARWGGLFEFASALGRERDLVIPFIDRVDEIRFSNSVVRILRAA